LQDFFRLFLSFFAYVGGKTLMDKFGILRLLTSFFDFYQKNRDSAPKGAPFDLLNSFMGTREKQGSNKNFSTESSKVNLESPSTLKNGEARAKSTPLQAGMLATLKTHDNFVKRVKEKHGV
jgi:hypothetical protein